MFCLLGYSIFLIIVLLKESIPFEYNVGDYQQEMAKIDYSNPKYVKDITIITTRKNRASPYLTHCNTTILHPWGNNVTMRITYQNMKRGDKNAIDFGVCIGSKWPWLADFVTKSTDIPYDKCPIPARTYHWYNIELPPRNLPFAVENGDFKVGLEAFIAKTMEQIYQYSLVIRYKKNKKKHLGK